MGKIEIHNTSYRVQGGGGGWKNNGTPGVVALRIIGLKIQFYSAFSSIVLRCSFVIHSIAQLTHSPAHKVCV